MTSSKLQQGIQAAQAGQREMARAILAQTVKEDPNNEYAWHWLSSVIEGDKEKLYCLQQVLRINPDNSIAAQSIKALSAAASPQLAPVKDQQVHCPQCKHTIRPGAQFCAHCGASLKPVTRQEPSVPPPSISSQARAAPSAPTADYRYPTEHQNLVVTVVAIIVALLVFSTVSLGFFFVMTALAVGINYLLIRTQAEGNMRSALRVSDRQRPDIKALVDECMHYVNAPHDTRVFITQSPVLNAYAFGLGKPYSIVLNSALVKNLDADELKYVIGHEMGHIKFGHTNLLTLIGQLGGETFGIPGVGMLIRYAFLFWKRSAEFTADRAGLVACGRLDKAVSTELKLGVGPELASEVNIRELARTWKEEKGNILGMFGEMHGTHPMMLTRIKQIVDFGTSDPFRYLRPDAVADFESAAEWLDVPPTQSVAALTPQNACPNCHNAIEAHWKVCPRCGTHLKQETQS